LADSSENNTAVTNSSQRISSQGIAPDGEHLRKPSFLGGFRRITSSGQYIPEIDGLRFIAISAVIIDHLGAIVAQAHGGVHAASDLGAKGVELFFVNSGFVLAMPFAAYYLKGAKPISLRRYFLRRITRLEPPYLLSLLLLLILKLLRDANVFASILPHLAASLFYVHGFIYGSPSTVSVVAWSLEVEVQFYVLMPLLAIVFLIRPRWIRRGVMVAGALAMMSVQPILIPTTVAPYQGHLLNYLQFFVAGLLLADVYATEWGNAPPAVRGGAIAWGDIVWLIGWPLTVWIVARSGIPARFLFPAMVFILYFSLFQSIWVRRLMRVPLIAVIGGMCYSIYLLHNAIIQAIGQKIMPMLPGTYPPAMALCTVTIIPPLLVICATFFRLVEKPCMRPDWPIRLWSWFMSHLFVEDQAAVSNSPGNTNGES
jgi:peptidoglycan/LPS O-acetylase OafA/YrhL